MLVEGDAASGLGSKTRPRRGGPPPASAADRCRRRHRQWLHVSKRQRRRQSTASGRCGGARLGTAVIRAAMSARHSARDDRARRRAPPAAASSPHAGEAQTPFSGRSDASELGAPEELEEGYAPGCLATPRSLLATVDFLAGSAADRGGGRGGIGTIFAGDRRRAVHDATPDGSASGISRDRLDGIRYLGYSRDAGPMTGPWGDQCADTCVVHSMCRPPSCFAHPLAIRAPVDQCLEYSS